MQFGSNSYSSNPIVWWKWGYLSSPFWYHPHNWTINIDYLIVLLHTLWLIDTWCVCVLCCCSYAVITLSILLLMLLIERLTDWLAYSYSFDRMYVTADVQAPTLQITQSITSGHTFCCTCKWNERSILKHCMSTIQNTTTNRLNINFFFFFFYFIYVYSKILTCTL